MYPPTIRQLEYLVMLELRPIITAFGAFLRGRMAGLRVKRAKTKTSVKRAAS